MYLCVRVRAYERMFQRNGSSGNSLLLSFIRIAGKNQRQGERVTCAKV
jgi:hypothetical protein